MQFLQPILNFIHEWADAWVLLTAVGTIALAIATFRVIQQGRQLRGDTKRQHRDRFKPICMLMPPGAVDNILGRGNFLELTAPQQEHQNHGKIVMRATLQNTGSGPALNLRLRLRTRSDAGKSLWPVELSPLAAGQMRHDANDPLTLFVPVYQPPRDKPMDGAIALSAFNSLDENTTAIILEYQDVFGRYFHSVHSRVPFDPSDLAKNDGTAARRIPWFTFHEGPAP